MTTDRTGDLARLRRAFTGHPSGGGEDCPDPALLWESAAGELDPAAETPILLHIAGCPDCATAWELAREMAEDAGRTGTVSPLARPGTPAWRRPGVLAAAATLLLAIGLGGSLLIHRPAPGPDVYREQAGGTVLRADPVCRRLPRAACRLRWTGAPKGTRYDVVVTDENLDVLCEARRLPDPEFLVPENTLPPAGSTILWRVTAHLPGGGTAASPTFETVVE